MEAVEVKEGWMAGWQMDRCMGQVHVIYGGNMYGWREGGREE